MIVAVTMRLLELIHEAIANDVHVTKRYVSDWREMTIDQI